MSYLLLNEGFEHLANDEYFPVHSPKEKFDNKWFIDIASYPYQLHFVPQLRQLVYLSFTSIFTYLILPQNTIFGVTTSMEIFTPEAVLELLSTLVPLLSRPPFSSSTLEKVAWKYSIYLYLHPGILYERLFSLAWLSVQGLGEGGWASGEDQPFCSWPTTGGAVTWFLV